MKISRLAARTWKMLINHLFTRVTACHSKSGRINYSSQLSQRWLLSDIKFKWVEKKQQQHINKQVDCCYYTQSRSRLSKRNVLRVVQHGLFLCPTTFVVGHKLVSNYKCKLVHIDVLDGFALQGKRPIYPSAEFSPTHPLFYSTVFAWMHGKVCACAVRSVCSMWLGDTT